MDAAAPSERVVSTRAVRGSGAVHAAPALLNAVFVRLATVGARVRGSVVPFVVLPLVGLLVGLILITAGCGPPS